MEEKRWFVAHMGDLLLKHKRTLFVAAVLAAAAYRSVDWLFFSGRIQWPIDFRAFWLSGGRALHEVYGPHPMPFVYPPTSLFLFKPFSQLPFLPSYFTWIALSAALFGFAVARVCGVKVAGLSFLSPAAIKGITLGQSAMLLGGALFAACRLQPLAMGAVLGLIAAVKPQLVLFAPLAFLLRRDWKTVGGMIAAFAVTALASLIAFGPMMWVDWVRAFPHFHDILIRFNVLSMAISPASRAEYLGLPPMPVLVASGAIATTAVVLLARRLEGEMLIALIVGASLAASPYAHVHDSIALIPACIILLQKARWPLALAAALIIIGSPAWTPVGLMAALLIAIVAAWPQRGQPDPGKIQF